MLLEVLVTERAGDRARGEGSGREAVLAALGEFFERARCGDLRSHKTHKKRNERVQHLSTGSRPPTCQAVARIETETYRAVLGESLFGPGVPRSCIALTKATSDSVRIGLSTAITLGLDFTGVDFFLAGLRAAFALD